MGNVRSARATARSSSTTAPTLANAQRVAGYLDEGSASPSTSAPSGSTSLKRPATPGSSTRTRSPWPARRTVATCRGRDDCSSSAITDYGASPFHVITPDHVVEIGAGNPLDLVDFYDAVTRLELHELEVKRILMNPVDLRDLYTWDIGVTGMKFKED